MTKANKRGGAIMLKLLAPGDIFGFQEPEPLPRKQWYPEMIASQLDSMARDFNNDLLDVVRGMDCKPISKSGSFFDIPQQPGVKDSWNDDHDEEGELEDEDDDEEK